MSWWGWITAAAAVAVAIYIDRRRSNLKPKRESAPGPEPGPEPVAEPVPEQIPEPAGDLVGEAPTGEPVVRQVILEDEEEIEPDPAAALAAAQAQNEPQRLNKWKTREVGKKKAKSLARKEQRRQWFEYVRERAGEEREREKLEREMFGDLLEVEQEERKRRIEEARAAIDQRRREQRAKDDELRADRERRRAELESQLKSRGRAELHSDEDLLLATDLGHVVGGGQWVVSVNDDLIDKIANSITGRTDYTEIAAALN